MRIIGGRDYYDGAGMGVDRSILFKRQAMPDPIPFDTTLPNTISWFDAGDHQIEFLIFLVGGECIPACIVTKRPWRHWLREAEASDLRIFGSFEEARPDLELAPLPLRFLDNRLSRRMESALAHFSRPRDSFMNLCLDEGIITGIIRPTRIGEKRSETGIVIEKNTDQLGANYLMRLLDPATAHMRISSFIGGVLPQNREVSEISDKDKIIKAGFDRTSFRDWAGKKKPRRRHAA